MRNFDYSKIKDKKWDSEELGLVSSVYIYQVTDINREVVGS